MAGEATILAMGDVELRWLLCGAAVAASLLGWVLLSYLRRRALRDAGGDPRTRFTVEQLRALLDAGQISKEEYSRLRKTLLGIKDGTGKTDSPLSKPSEDDDGSLKEQA